MAVLDKNGLTYLWGKVKAYFTNHTSNTNNPHNVTADQIGLGNVDNTADSSKNVAFASEAASARKVKYSIILRLKGGNTEGTDKWTFDGSTSKSVNITAAKIGAVAVSQGTANAGKIFYVGTDGNATMIDIATLKQLLDSAQ